MVGEVGNCRLDCPRAATEGRYQRRLAGDGARVLGVARGGDQPAAGAVAENVDDPLAEVAQTQHQHSVLAVRTRCHGVHSHACCGQRFQPGHA